MTAKGKKDSKQKGKGESALVESNDFSESTVTEINSKEDLRNFLLNVKEKLQEHGDIFALSALRHVMDIPQIQTLLDNENKELARDIWLRLKQAGLQVKNPPLLFRADEEDLQPGT